MRKTIFTLVLAVIPLWGFSQQASPTFQGYFANNEYNVYIRINLKDNNITIPGHELFGELPGYLGKTNNSFVWIITSGKQKHDKATLSLINDYGSEDLTAEITQKNDSVLMFRQLEGSALKVPNKGKWQKLPKEFTLIRK